MKYKHFQEIEPSNKTDFIMLYFAACRSLRELESAIRRTNDGKLTCHQAWLLRRIQRKFVQMAARHKAYQRNEMPIIPNAKYPTGIVIDLKSPQGSLFYLIGLANRLVRETWPVSRRNCRIQARIIYCKHIP